MNTITNTTFPEAAGISASCIIDALREINIRVKFLCTVLYYAKMTGLVAEGAYAPVKKTTFIVCFLSQKAHKHRNWIF